MKQGLSEEKIIEIAKHKTFVVHAYRWSHYTLRNKTRRMHRDGLLVRVHAGKGCFAYRAAEVANV